MVERFEQFSFAVSAICRHIQKIEREEMEAYGYRGAFAQYLVTLNRFPEGLTAAELCEVCDRDKAAISRITGEMEEKGLIFREMRVNSSYKAKLKLTDEGKKAARFVCDRASAAVSATGGQISDEDRKILYRSLELILKKLQIIAKEGIPEAK